MDNLEIVDSFFQGDIEAVRSLFKGKVPPQIMRFVKLTGKGINQHQMIEEGDRVLLGVSGGKDSLAMALALSLRRKWLPVRYELQAVQIDWAEHQMNEEQARTMEQFFDAIEVPYTRVKAQINPPSFKGEFNCYLCSRNKRRILFNYAGDNHFNKVAQGHHLDDIVETTLINLCFRGDFHTMNPHESFFNGKLFVIRPMCLVPERMIVHISQALQFPILEISCAKKTQNIRLKIKPIIEQLSKMDKNLKEHIYNAHFNLNKKINIDD